MATVRCARLASREPQFRDSSPNECSENLPSTTLRGSRSNTTALHTRAHRSRRVLDMTVVARTILAGSSYCTPLRTPIIPVWLWVRVRGPASTSGRQTLSDCRQTRRPRRTSPASPPCVPAPLRPRALAPRCTLPSGPLSGPCQHAPDQQTIVPTRPAIGLPASYGGAVDRDGAGK